jgi:hypothetical protein
MDCAKIYKIPSDRIADRIIEDEAVILNLDNGQYYTLNYVGTLIWKMIGCKKSLGEILSSLKKEYNDTCEDKLKKDVITLVSRLEKEKLVERLKGGDLA